jgi:hypothetical protein
MIADGRIPRRLVSQGAPGTPPRLRLEGLAEAIQGSKRWRCDSRPGPAREPQPLPAPPGEADRLALQGRIAELQGQLSAALARERAWVAAYEPFRGWAREVGGAVLQAGCDPADGSSLLSQLQPLLLAELRALDAADHRSRWP